MLLYHDPPVEQPHSSRTLICTETIKSADLEIDIITQEFHFGKSALLSHGVNEVTHLLHIRSSPKAFLPQTVTLTHCVMDGDASLVAKTMIQY